MNTAKIVISWRCNLDCSYCCNKQQALRDTFKPITLRQIHEYDYDDYEITGGEPLWDCNLITLGMVMDRIPNNRNVYLYTNGVFLDISMAIRLQHIGVTAINVGYHQFDLDWDTLRVIDEMVLPIRLWVKEGEVTDKMKEFDIRIWKLGECDNITTDRFVLEL